MGTVKNLNQIVSDKDRIITENIEEKYLTDILGRTKGKAAAVVFPVSTEEVSQILKYAWDNAIPVTPRGAGTNLVGSTVPIEGGIILDLSKMDRILEVDSETFTATVEPGVVLGDFQKYVEEKGYFYPPDPGEKRATIGGNISTNAGGMRAVKYGVTRDYVRGLEVVLADGRVVTLGSKNVKDASGLSLKNLIVGSEGTLAVITKCILKIIPKPEANSSVLIPFADIKTGIENVLKIIQSNTNPTAIEFVEQDVVKLGETYTGKFFPGPRFAGPEPGAYIILTFDGGQQEIEERKDRVKHVVLNAGALDFIELLDDRVVADVWEIRGCLVKAVEEVSEQEPVDLVVPINKVADFIAYVNEYEQKAGIRMIRFGHAGDGNVHLCIERGDRTKKDWEHDLHQTMEHIYKKAYDLGGLTSGEHGIGISKQAYYLEEADKDNLFLMRQIKEVFDRKHILNHKKVYMKNEEYTLCGN